MHSRSDQTYNEKPTLIESIYFDVDTGTRASRYTNLIEKLAAAETAHAAHLAMSERVRLLHVKRIADVRHELEAEGKRLRGMIKAALA